MTVNARNEVVVGSDNGYFYALQGTNGAVVWKSDAGIPDVQRGPVGAPLIGPTGTVYASVGAEGHHVALKSDSLPTDAGWPSARGTPQNRAQTLRLLRPRILSPAPIVAGQNVLISSEVRSIAGPIDQVQIVVDGLTLFNGPATNSTVSWTNAPPGSHELALFARESSSVTYSVSSRFLVTGPNLTINPRGAAAQIEFVTHTNYAYSLFQSQDLKRWIATQPAVTGQGGPMRWLVPLVPGSRVFYQVSSARKP